MRQRGCLGAQQVLGLALTGQLRIDCESGLLWVTGPGSGDVLLEAGTGTVIDGSGRVVIQALRPAEFVLERAPTTWGYRGAA